MVGKKIRQGKIIKPRSYGKSQKTIAKLPIKEGKELPKDQEEPELGALS
jgi:hypothetical protein